MLPWRDRANSAQTASQRFHTQDDMCNMGVFDKFYLRGRELIIILGKMIGSCQVSGGHEKYKRLFWIFY